MDGADIGAGSSTRSARQSSGSDWIRSGGSDKVAAKWQMAHSERSLSLGDFSGAPCGVLRSQLQHSGQPRSAMLFTELLPESVITPRVWPGTMMFRKIDWNTSRKMATDLFSRGREKIFPPTFMDRRQTTVDMLTRQSGVVL